MAMMKAAVLTKYGSLLELKEVPIPQVGSNEVLVKLIACAKILCAADRWQKTGLFRDQFQCCRCGTSLVACLIH